MYKLRNKSNNDSWIETTATFTGKKNKASVKTKTGFREVDYYEYEIVYRTDINEQHGWYTFYPLPDPEIEEIKGKCINIAYNKNKPYEFK